MTLSQDILAELAEIAPDSALAGLSCMTAMRWRPTMPVLVLPTPHPRGWPRRWPLPDC